MVSKVIFVLAAVCLCGALAKPTEQGDSLKNLLDEFANVATSLGDEFKKTFDIKDTKESKQLVDSVKTGSDELVGKLTTLLENVNKEVKAHSGEAGKAFDDLKAKASETVKKLQEAHPAEAAKAKEYQKQFEDVVNGLVNQTKETVAVISKDTSGLQEDISKFTESLIKGAKSSIEKVDAEVKKTLAEHAKEHKH